MRALVAGDLLQLLWIGLLLDGLEVPMQLLIAFLDLALQRLIHLEFLFENEQQLRPPVPFQALRDHFLTGLNAWIPQFGQFPRIALPF